MTDGQPVQRYARHPLLDMKILPEGTVTPAMMEAGRKAFRRNRRRLDDLHAYFPCDLDVFLKAVYRAMARAS